MVLLTARIAEGPLHSLAAVLATCFFLAGGLQAFLALFLAPQQPFLLASLPSRCQPPKAARFIWKEFGQVFAIILSAT